MGRSHEKRELRTESAIDRVKILDYELSPRHHVLADARELLIVVRGAAVFFEAAGEHQVRVMQALLDLRQP